VTNGRTYGELVPIDRADVEAAGASGDAERISHALIRAALHDSDRSWIESRLSQSLTDPNVTVRRAAAISAGHVGRLHRNIDRATIVPLLEALRSDPAMGGDAENALEDIATFASGDER
jgi:hypothetical protein